jgi:hypothetical protein
MRGILLLEKAATTIVEEILRQVQERTASRLEVSPVHGLPQKNGHVRRRQGIL